MDVMYIPWTDVTPWSIGHGRDVHSMDCLTCKLVFIVLFAKWN